MALFRDDEGRTEKATPQRLDEARNKGQVALSHEFVMAGTLVIGVLLLERFGSNLIAVLQESLRAGLDVRLENHHLGDGGIDGFWRESVSHLVRVGPWFVFFLCAFLGATLLTGYGQIGFRFNTEALGFKFEKLNPVTNFKRLFQPAAINRTLLSVGKLSILASVLWFVLRSRWQRFAMLYGVADFPSAVLVMAEAVLAVFFWISAAVMTLSFLDIAWQRFDLLRGLMMTKQEVEDERKRTDGDPMIKNKQRIGRPKARDWGSPEH